MTSPRFTHGSPAKKIRPQRKTPLPHQAEALANILAALREQDRATALMACGTGKTLVALWAAEKVTQALLPASQNTQAGVPAPLILILVPSLALLGQTLHEWARETSWPALAHLCVCSDPAVKSDRDEIILRSSDLDFPVTTDSAQVSAFLTAEFDGVKCTDLRAVGGDGEIEVAGAEDDFVAVRFHGGVGADAEMRQRGP